MAVFLPAGGLPGNLYPGELCSPALREKIQHAILTDYRLGFGLNDTLSTGILSDLLKRLFESLSTGDSKPFLEAFMTSRIYSYFKAQESLSIPVFIKQLQQTCALWRLSPEEKNFLEGMFQQAMFMFTEGVERELALARVLEEDEIHSLHRRIDYFVETRNLANLVEVLAAKLPEMGVISCYLSLYDYYEQDRFPAYSRPIFALNENGRLQLKAGEVFPTKKLIPERLFSRDRRFTYLVENLYFGQTQLGFCVYEFENPLPVSVWDIASRTFLNVALKAAIYVQKVQADYLVFEEKVNVRTGELSKANKTLEELYQKQIAAEKELKLLNEELELRVRDRTSQLESAYNRLRDTINWLTAAQKQLVLSEKMAALGNLVAGIAHEINTPLGIGVTAASHMQRLTRQVNGQFTTGQLKRSQLGDYLNQAEEASAMVMGNLQRAYELISNFKKVAVDQSNEEKRSFKVRDYIQSVLISLKPQWKKVGPEIRVKCDPGLEIHSYPGALAQIITNLLLNSLTHGFSGRSGGLIILNIRPGKEILTFRFCDNGRGIEKEYLEKIFDPFFTTNRSKGGTGLGLHLVFNLVVSTFRGDIKCVSRPGRGTLFKMLLDVS